MANENEQLEHDDRKTDPVPPPESEPAIEVAPETERVVTASIVATPVEVQRAISDRFATAWMLTREAPLVDDMGMYGRLIAGFQVAALELRKEHALEPVQIIGGAVRWLWDFAQRQLKLPTDDLGQFMVRNWTRFEAGGTLMFRAGSPESDDVLMGVTCWLWHFARVGAVKAAGPGLECYGARWSFSELVGYTQRALSAFDDQNGQAMRSRIVGRS